MKTDSDFELKFKNFILILDLKFKVKFNWNLKFKI